MPSKRIRVAICQPQIILGGRLHVILAIARVLNEMGIVPDIITFRLKFAPSQLTTSYKRNVRVRFKVIKYFPRFISQDLSIFFFNELLNHYGKAYDLLINSANSPISLRESMPVLHYFHFPREKRLTSPVPDIHQPDLRFTPYSPKYLERQLIRILYRRSRLPASHNVVSNSAFTHQAVAHMFGNLPSNNTIVYPPVLLEQSVGISHKTREPSMVSMGRFSPDKRQLEQIKLAEKCPAIIFHIIGFVGNKRYYNRCLDYIREKNMTNVQLHPGASHNTVAKLLRESRYFLHSTVNEPFGITAVQAVAAGCIPIVHDSGGQRETVPEDNLRYRELNEVPEILDWLESSDEKDVLALKHRLVEHARRNYDGSIFHRKMKDLLTKIFTESEGGYSSVLKTEKP